MRKGIFWAIDECGEQKLLTYFAECDDNGAVPENQPPYNSQKGGSFAHKQSWGAAAKHHSRDIRNKPWNHFPRGRVELRDGKTTVYHNPVLSEWKAFEEEVCKAFCLKKEAVRFKPDGSAHYRFLKGMD